MSYHLFFDLSYHPDFDLHLPTAYIAEERAGYWHLFKRATPEVLQSLHLWQPSEAAAAAIALVDDLQPPALLKKYLKKGTTLEELYRNKEHKKHLQEQVEERTAQLLQCVVEQRMPLTVGYTHRDEIAKKRVAVSDKVLTPSLEFEKTAEGIIYRLYLFEGEQRITPREAAIELLNNAYCWLVLDGSLVRVADLKASHLKPFLTKEATLIPERNIEEYFEKFLKKILRKVPIKAIGFAVIERKELLGAELRLLHDFFANHYKLTIAFDYGGYTFESQQRKDTQSDLAFDEQRTPKIYHYRRDKEAEAVYHKALTRLGFAEEEGTFYLKDSTDPFATYAALLTHRAELTQAGFSVSKLLVGDKEIAFEEPALRQSPTTTDNDWFDLNIEVQHGDCRFHFKELVGNLKAQNPVYELPNGKLFIIPQEWFARFGTVVKYTQERGGKLQLPRSNYALLEALPELRPASLLQEVDYTPSPNLKATLRPYQIAGVKWLLEHYHNGMGACLADDMGLGKTLQTLALLTHIHDSLPEHPSPYADLFSQGELLREPLRVLVILPSSLIFNWYDEAKRFAPHLKCTQYVGSDRKVKLNRLQHYDLVFTSYPIVALDAKLLQRHEFRYIILDESQRIKNHTSKTFKAINSLKAAHKLSLSGTPIENSLSDLWAQMQFINPDILQTYASFNKHFIIEIQKKHNPVALEELKTIISPFLLRRTKAQVLTDLPDMEEQIAYCSLADEQRKWYEREKSKVRNELLHIEGQVSQISTLKMLMRLRQISNHPRLADKESTLPSGKYEEVISTLQMIVSSGQKALVFSSFTTHLQLYEDWCKQAGVKYVHLSGSTPLAERRVAVSTFQSDPTVPLFFLSLKAGEVGLNLTRASYVLLLDPWWNPFSERQAIGRAHRLGQENKVNVIRFVSKDTIEEKIIKLQQAKAALSAELVEEKTIISEVMEQMEDILA